MSEVKMRFTVAVLHVCVLLFSVQARVSYGIDTQTNCTTANATCSECYQTLVKNVVHDNENIFGLLQTFFPPNDHPPVFVIVKYHFEDSDTTFTYFWTLKSSFFIVPLEISQFLSLFFGTPAYHSSSVSLTLPSECEEGSPEYFEMLTYLLKAYAATQSATPRIVNEYTTGRGANATTIGNFYNHGRSSDIIICYSFFISFIGNIVITLFIALHRDEISKYLGNDNDGSAIKLSIVIVCTIFFIYVCCINVAAIAHNTPPAIAEYYKGALEALPFCVLFFDNLLPTVAYIIIIIRKCAVDEFNAFEYMVVFSVSVVACTFINHSLYITIAFINDPYHATAVTIYYLVFSFIHLVVLKKVLILCYKGFKKFNVSDVCTRICCIVASVIPTLVVLLGLQILCTSVYIYIPIKDAIDDIPHQLQSLLQLLTTFFVGLISYKFLGQPKKVYIVEMQNIIDTKTKD